MLTEQELLREAAETGFQKDALEKVIRLTELLESLRSHPFLKQRIVLKGGRLQSSCPLTSHVRY